MDTNTDYLKHIRQKTLQQVVTDLVTEKINSSITNKRAQLQIDSYRVKIATLACLGIKIDYFALAQRVNREYKKSPHYLNDAGKLRARLSS